MSDETELIPAGPSWCKEFPTSCSMEDLVSPFRENCKAFVAALIGAGAIVHISDTLRPKQRVWLMRQAWLIAKGEVAPENVPACDGINIQWGLATPEESIAAAQAMVSTYQIVHEPVLGSRHEDGLAIDMTITFPECGYLDLRGGRIFESQPQQLYAAGRAYGVIKLVSDKPHWSNDGH